MYALAIVRYRRPFAEIAKSLDAHRAYLRDLKAKGVLVASGPLDPRMGGAILLRITADDVQAALDQVRDGDPFSIAGLVQYEMWPWNVGIGAEDLDRI